MRSAAPNGAFSFFRYHDGETARCSPFLFSALADPSALSYNVYRFTGYSFTQ